MLQKKKPDVDVIMDVLKETLTAYPESTFVQSLLHQYQERGGLSKKQLEGLYGKALKVKTILHGKLATLEAIILKKSSSYKSPIPLPMQPVSKDENIGRQIHAILEKYPAHKRVLFYKVRYDDNAAFSPLEKSEIERFHKLLC
jgi:hypothetical protein